MKLMFMNGVHRSWLTAVLAFVFVQPKTAAQSRTCGTDDEDKN